MIVRSMIVLLFAATLDVHGVADPYVPPELEPWRAWVLEKHESVVCPHAATLGFTCQWPGVLALDVGPDGVRFEQHWRLFAAGWVPLPGDAQHWPESLRINGEPAPIGRRQERPTIYLQAGEYRLSGHISWTRPPEHIGLPAAVGVVRLAVSGERVHLPQWEGDALWLGGREAGVREEDELELRVHRLFADGEPRELTTHVAVYVSGGAREERLGPALLPGFVPMSVVSELPVRVDEHGMLHAQLRPGYWEIRLHARALADPDQLGPPQAQAPWPSEEIWSYRADEALRVTAVEGAAPVDPRQTDMPGAWERLPAYRLTAGEMLHIVEHSRGLDPRHGNQLSLERNMWLRFDGSGWIVDDRISGAMVHAWRLDMAEPYRLTRVTEADEPRMLTRRAGQAAVGAEIRDATVAVHAVSLVDAGTMPVAGWLNELRDMNATLHLPPGYRLLAVSGFDRASGDWFSRWGLMSIFGVIMVAVAVARLYGPVWGVVALAALTLTVHESGAPLWLWLNAVLALALMAALSAGWLRRAAGAYAVFALLLLSILFVPFALEQARLAVFPQAPTLGPPEIRHVARQWSEPARPMAPEMVADAAVARAEDGAAELDRVQVTGSRIRPQDLVEPYMPGALVQAGTATPAWHWRQAYVSLGGPVRAEQTARFWITPPWLTGLWRIAGIVLGGLLLGRLILRIAHLFGRLPPGRRSAAAGIALLAMFSGAATAAAPDPAILAELESRLTRPPACTPHCVQIQRADIGINAGALRIELDIHALDAGAVAVPGGRDGWSPEEIGFADGTGAWLLRRDGRLWVPLPAAGRYVLVLHGSLPETDAFNLDFPLRPMHVTADVVGWDVSGARDGVPVSDSLRFTRLDHGAAPADLPQRWRERLEVPPFVIVERHFFLDVEWYSRTRILRRAPADAGFTVSIPLLDGEMVQSHDALLSVAAGRATATFPPGEDEVVYGARLSRQVPLELAAGDADHYRERWNFTVSHLWSAAFEGAPPAATVHDAGFAPTYFPRPGERLSVWVERPEAVSGETLSFERVILTTDVGRRARRSTLVLDYRATQGGSHAIGLPAGVTLHGMRVNGRGAGVSPVDGNVLISIMPGTHRVELEWERPADRLWAVTTPRPDLRADAANIELRLRLPEDRWVVWTAGSRMGPVVMYWFELVLMLLLATLLLGRFRRLPVNRAQWVLLALGLSLTAWPVLLLLFGWLFLLDWRGREAGHWGRLRFNLSQIGLSIVSVVALVALLTAMSIGLLSSPDMGIVGHGSHTGQLNWFIDHGASGALPAARVVSLPMWSYKAVILLWSVWLSLALISWLKWAWSRLAEGGLWRGRPVVAEAEQ